MLAALLTGGWLRVHGPGSASSALDALPAAALAYRESSITLGAGPGLSDGPVEQTSGRDREVLEVMAVETSLAHYFSLLDALASTGTAAPDDGLPAAAGPRLERSRSLESYPEQVDAGRALQGIVSRHAALQGREQALRDLVGEAGPPAMRLVAQLREIAGRWRKQVEIDCASVLEQLDSRSAERETSALLRQIAHSRAPQLKREYAQRLARIDAADAALARIAHAHAVVQQRLGTLSGPALHTLLQSTVADLRSAQLSVAQLR
jgi:hypothetical protein